jgi:hypothetical protein
MVCVLGQATRGRSSGRGPRAAPAAATTAEDADVEKGRSHSLHAAIVLFYHRIRQDNMLVSRSEEAYRYS